jgi:uncharacterized protein (DUF488 family)
MSILYTIGFTQKSAKEFFELLKGVNVDILIDVRLNNTGQLAGFTKKRDLAFFLELVGIQYQHWKDFAPTKEMRTKYHNCWNWLEYEREYRTLVQHRDALRHLDGTSFQNTTLCLMCSEPTSGKCHRRLAAEMIAQEIGNLEIVHL